MPFLAAVNPANKAHLFGLLSTISESSPSTNKPGHIVICTPRKYWYHIVPKILYWKALPPHMYVCTNHSWWTNYTKRFKQFKNKSVHTNSFCIRPIVSTLTFTILSSCIIIRKKSTGEKVQTYIIYNKCFQSKAFICNTKLNNLISTMVSKKSSYLKKKLAQPYEHKF